MSVDQFPNVSFITKIHIDCKEAFVFNSITQTLPFNPLLNKGRQTGGSKMSTFIYKGEGGSMSNLCRSHILNQIEIYLVKYDLFQDLYA